MKELITIIIPVYNVEKYLDRCVESVLRQTYSNLEIILVDDGSPDKCPEMCDEYAKVDKRVKVIHKENGGLSDARNVGLCVAKGKYVSFVDSDDWIPINSIEVLYANLVETNSDISSGVLLEVFQYENESQFKNNYVKYETEESLKNLCLLHGLSNSASGKLYDIKLFENIKYPVSKLYEDLGTTYKVFAKTKNVVVSDMIVYFYFQNQDSIVHKKYSSKRLDAFAFAQEQESFIAKNYPKLKQFARYRTFYECLSILNDMPFNCTDKKNIKNYIKKYRKSVLKIPELYKKQRILCYASFGGQLGIKLAFKIKTYLKKKKVTK